MAPVYISDLCVTAMPTERQRSLRSVDTNAHDVIVPVRTNKACFYDRAFSVAGPLAWNNLPSHIKNKDSDLQFKTLLKTAMFQQSYSNAPLG